MTRWQTIRMAFVDTIIVWPGVAPFGMVYAVSALAAGLSLSETIGMSLIVFAGASQFTAVGLFGSGSHPLSIIATTAIINARHLLLAASTASYIRRAPAWSPSARRSRRMPTTCSARSPSTPPIPTGTR